MPRWVAHARQLAALQRRWNVNAAISELSTGVVPVIIVDEHRDADDSDILGMLTQATGDAVNIPACALVAQELELLVHKVEFWWSQIRTLSRPVHIFTPLQNYTPFDVSASSYFAWLQGAAIAQDIAKVGRAFGVGGYGSGHQVVNVNGVPITTFGPTVDYEFWLGGASGTAVKPPRELWGFQDPPIRLKPFTLLCVQSTFAAMGAAEVLNVNFYYSERAPQGDVG